MRPFLGFLARAARERGSFEARRLDADTFLVQRKGAREVVTLGRGQLGVTLLVDPPAARRHALMIQKRMGEFLSAHMVTAVLEATEANLVLDVGANAGQYGAALRRAGYRGRIASFEPVSGPLEKLRRAASSDPAWDVYGCALGERDESAEINRVPGTMSSFLSASRFGKGWSDRLRSSETETVQVRRLDSMFAEVAATVTEPRVYLKMDTQGFDLSVFSGAGPVLDRVVAMQSEVACVPIYEGMVRFPEQWQRYEDAGFEAVGLYPVSFDPATLRAIEFDLLMVRPGAVGAGAVGVRGGPGR